MAIQAQLEQVGIHYSSLLVDLNGLTDFTLQVLRSQY